MSRLLPSRKALLITTCLLSLAALTAHPAIAEVVVIVHPSNDVVLDEDALRHIFMGKKSTFPNNKKAIPADLAEGPSRTAFVQKYLRKSEIQLENYWSVKLFTGKGKRPQTFGNETAMKKAVAKNPDMIGYIDSKNIDESVKALEITQPKLRYFNKEDSH